MKRPGAKPLGGETSRGGNGLGAKRLGTISTGISVISNGNFGDVGFSGYRVTLAVLCYTQYHFTTFQFSAKMAASGERLILQSDWDQVLK